MAAKNCRAFLTQPLGFVDHADEYDRPGYCVSQQNGKRTVEYKGFSSDILRHAGAHWHHHGSRCGCDSSFFIHFQVCLVYYLTDKKWWCSQRRKVCTWIVKRDAHSQSCERLSELTGKIKFKTRHGKIELTRFSCE